MRKFALALLVLLLSVCPSMAQRIKVGTSIFPLYDWVRAIGGDRVDAFCMLEPGASPHTFAPKPADVVRINDADVFFVVGRGLEPWVERIVKPAERRGVVVVRLGEGIDGALESIGYSERLLSNPHIWLDPLAAEIMVGRIADELCGISPKGCQTFKDNLASYSVVLNGLAREMASLGEELKGRKVVTQHASFDHFLFRSGIALLGVVERSPGQEPSSAYLKKLMDDMKRENVRVVFAEPQLSPREAKLIASELGGAYEILDPLGGVAGRDSYERLVRFNIGQLRKALE